MSIIFLRFVSCYPMVVFFMLITLATLSQAADQEGKYFTNTIGMTFVKIPAGSFQMGSPSHEPGRQNTETQHHVSITSPYYMQTTEVTQAQWYAVMGTNPSNFKGKNLPVEQVSWEDARKFIRKLNNKEGSENYRLPTESEWEYAARAGSNSSYCSGDNLNDLDKHAWYRVNSGGRTHPVADKRPNLWGLYDVHGNVWEWVQDWYDDYASGTVDDPKGPDAGAIRVRRGGGWMSTDWSCRSASRSGNEPGYTVFAVGFRLAFNEQD